MNLFRDIEIRRAEPADAAAIASLLADSFAEYEPLYTAEGYAATVITDEQIVERIGQGPVWVALWDEIVVGTVSVVARNHSLYVRGMAVQPTARGQHIGERLLIEVESLAIAGKFRRPFLSTTPFLDRAISLYERFGFQRNEEGPHELFGTRLFTMEKFLPDKP
jgi:ribosomal protein S18 acetylase RimI-like enzyme